MATVNTVGQRFVQLIQHLGISKNAFALSLDKTATVVQHLVDERNKPGYDLLCKVFEVYPPVSKDWLLLGQGPMLIPADVAATPTPTLPAAAEARAAAAQPAAPRVPRQTELSLPPAPPETSMPTAEKPAGKEATVPFAAAASLAAPVAAAPAAPSAPPGPASTPTGISAGNAEAVLTAALHTQHMQHQLALAEQRNQHLLEQQRLMQQLLDFAQRR